MDPNMLYAKPEKIRAEVKAVLAKFGHGNGHVFYLGHGITPDVPPEHAIEFFKAVREESVQYHAK